MFLISSFGVKGSLCFVIEVSVGYFYLYICRILQPNDYACEGIDHSFTCHGGLVGHLSIQTHFTLSLHLLVL